MATSQVKKSSNKTNNRKKKKNVKSRIDIEKYNNDVFMFSILLSVICILAVSLKSYQFTVLGNNLPFSLFVVPFIIFISNYITKKFGFKNSLFSICVSSLIIIAFLLLIYNLTNREASIFEMFGLTVTYFGSLFVNLLIYYYVIFNMTSKSIMIGLNYVFICFLNSFLYLLFFHEMVLSNSLWMQLTISFIIQFIISIGLIYCDRKIERGVNI
ncbi:MAG: hypothetical protein Q4E39_02100 [bacterium]|nr:hypothetical protein [bacterium]